MRYTIYIIGVFLCLLSGCGASVSPSVHAGYDTLYRPVHSRHFVVLGSGDSVVLRVLDPWQGASGVVMDYFFDSGVGAGRVVTLSSSHSAFLEALGVAGRLVGVSAPGYLTSSVASALPDVGYDTALNFEVIASLAPDLLTCYEVAGGNSTSLSRLAGIGVRALYVADYLEPTALAKAEWVVAFGAMTGSLGVGIEIFQKIEQDYLSTLSEVLDLLELSGAVRPRVMLNSPYRDVWYLPGDDSFIVGLLRDAGGDYAAAGTPGNVSRAVSVERAYDYLSRSDIWLHPSADIGSVGDLRRAVPVLGEIHVPVFNNNRLGGRDGGSDVWESGTLRCDLVLRDLAHILHPTLFPNHTLHYYHPLSQ